MKTALTHILYLVIVWAIFTLALARWFNPVYAGFVQPHAGLALTGYNSLAHIPRLKAVFLCVPFGNRPSMVKLEGDAFARAGILTSQSVNPFQLCHPHLTVNGKASNQSLGAHNHA